MIKIQIKTVFGKLFFEHESEKNTISETVQKMIDENKGKLINYVDLSGLNLSNVNFNNSKFNGSKFNGKTFDEKTFKSLIKSNSFESVKYEFFGKMLFLKGEVSFLKESLINGKIDGNVY